MLLLTLRAPITVYFRRKPASTFPVPLPVSMFLSNDQNPYYMCSHINYRAFSVILTVLLDRPR